MTNQVDFNIGDKIVAIKDSTLRKGIIKYVYAVNPPVARIEFEDGEVEKVFLKGVAHEPKPETQDQKINPRIKSKITITPDEFRDIASRVIMDDPKTFWVDGLKFAVLMGKIYNVLFMESCENDNFLD